MNTNEAAELLGITPRYLEKRRNNRLGPAHIRLSPKAVRYRREDLETYLDDPLHSEPEELRGAVQGVGGRARQGRRVVG